MQSVLIHGGILITPRERVVGSLGSGRDVLSMPARRCPPGPGMWRSTLADFTFCPDSWDLQLNCLAGHDFMSGNAADVSSVATLLAVMA